jgi:hypothetical protein
MKKVILSLFILFVFLFDLAAQCPMCRMTAESNLQNGGTAGAGLNAGIMYMLVAPYLIVGGIAFWWWRNKKKEASEDKTEEWLTPGSDQPINLN